MTRQPAGVREKFSFLEGPRWHGRRTAPGFSERERRDTREAVLLAVRVDVPGV
jgi:hypothetical protein